MANVLKHMFTEQDNETFDVTKALAAFVIIAGVALTFVSVLVKDLPVSLQDYGTGMGLLFAGLGVALGMKKESDASVE
jgi:hypothetical protein